MEPEVELRVGGVIPFTTIDFPEKLSAVIFTQGCPWRCVYCHNPHLQQLNSPPAKSWQEVLDWLRSRVGLLDGVVFSGGEPTLDRALLTAMKVVRELGFAIGIHTGGMYPAVLRKLLPLIDWIGLDVKAPLDDEVAYASVVGREGDLSCVVASLEAVLASGKAYEIRTTIHPQWLNEGALLRLARQLKQRGVSHYTVQYARNEGNAPLSHGIDYPSAAALMELRESFSVFKLR